MNKPLLLMILDGWGYSEDKTHNAIALANKPNWDELLRHYPHGLISGCGLCVGLPEGQMGNSEVGHLNMGAGRIVHQDLTRINQSIQTGEFLKNPVLTKALSLAIQNNKAIHLMGLLSPGGVHADEAHFHSVISMASKLNAKHLYVHAFLDGRDTPPKSAKNSLLALNAHMAQEKLGTIASLTGRYYAMDRDKRYDRTHKTYDLLVQGIADFEANDAVSGLEAAYARGETDEFVRPTKLNTFTPIESGDVVIFMNFRADRARQLTRAFVDPDFTGFSRTTWPHLGAFVTLTEYDADLPTDIAFPPARLTQIFPEYISQQGLKQLRIAETEKYAHVTFFFNGGIETPYPNEDRLLIPSPKVATYDLQPEMSAPKLTEELITAIKSQQYDVIICNFANADMVGHTGNIPATIKAIETLDTCIGQIVAALKEVRGEVIITADHGNAELMFDEKTEQPHTAHTDKKVPFLYIGRNAKIIHDDGILSDIAPTMLYLLGLKVPKEMTGRSLIEIL